MRDLGDVKRKKNINLPHEHETYFIICFIKGKYIIKNHKFAVLS